MNRLTPAVKVPNKVRTRRIIKLITRTFWTLLALILIFQLVRLNSFLSKTSSSNLDQASAQVEVLQKELDEIREYLLIPSSNDENTENDKQEATLDQLLTGLLQESEDASQAELRQQKYLQTLESSISKLDLTALDQANLKLHRVANLLQVIDSNLEIENQESLQEDALITFGYDNSKLILTTPLSQSSFLTNQTDSFQKAIQSQFTASNLTALLQSNESLKQAESSLQNLQSETPDSLQSLLDAKNLTFFSELNTPFKLQGLRADNSLAFQITYNPKNQTYSLQDFNQKTIGQPVADLNQILINLETFLKLHTFPTLIEQNIAEKLEQIQTLITSAQFTQKLQKSNLQIVRQENEQEYLILFQNKTTKSTTFSLVLNKQTAELTIQSNGQVKKVALATDQLKKNSKLTNFLIAGKQGSLTDTLILASLNESSKEVSLLSVPRDLYLNGKKINSIYAEKGMPSLVETLESVLGQEIQNYLLIDMYAFIDVVDYIGGVDVYLDAEISDPTYKTYDNGVWSTMYFARGEHTLNGTQALRLARSRYTSSDFARAERQQLILTALKDKLTSLGFKDAKAISQIGLTLYQKTETDLALNKAIASFFKYKDFQVSQKSVLSTGNILVSAYSNEYNKVNCANCGRGAYILIPKNNDWSLLKTYVAGILNT